MSCALAESPAPPLARVPIRSGRAYRVPPLPAHASVTPTLAGELARVLERFAAEAGFTAERPIEIVFKPGVVGHHQVGRAADIYAIGGRGLDAWKAEWDAAAAGGDPARERQRNLGWRLYKAIQTYGRWAKPSGYPIQLFGPWTRSEGPWQRISDALLFAHRDHIHVAK
jgi:hypothetical protein